MLMLTRKRGESVDLVDRSSGAVLATVTTLEFLADASVRLGFTAPPHIAIIRDNAKDKGGFDRDQTSNSSGAANGNR